jgi:hypothetical protein
MAKSKAKQALDAATKARDNAVSWVDLHNALFGIGGEISRLFPTEAERIAFTRTDEFAAITAMADELRADQGDPEPLADRLERANGNISVRLPRSIHAALLAEAELEGVSLNQLCLAKLCVHLRAGLVRG